MAKGYYEKHKHDPKFLEMAGYRVRKYYRLKSGIKTPPGRLGKGSVLYA